MITISKHYEENVNLGNFESVRVGVTVSSDKKLENTEAVKHASEALFQIAKQLVQKDIEQIRKERGVTNE